MNPHANTSESQTTIPYGYALRVFFRLANPVSGNIDWFY